MLHFYIEIIKEVLYKTNRVPTFGVTINGEEDKGGQWKKGKDLAETSEDLRTMVMEQGAVVTDHSGADPSTHSVYPVPEGDPGPRQLAISSPNIRS